MHLKVLIIEDNEDDAALLARYLAKCGFDPKWQRVDNRDSLAEMVEDRRWDLVLCDLSMPELTPFLAVDCVRQVNPDIPIIIVTGAIPEQIAARLIQHGVQDIVLKDDLPRLRLVIRRELDYAAGRRAKLAAELRLANALDKLDQGVALYDEQSCLITANQRYRATLDRLQNEIVPGLSYAELLRIAVEREQFVLPEPGIGRDRSLRRLLAYHACTSEPFEQQQHDGRWVEVQRHRTEDGGIVTVTTDITDAKRREETLMQKAAEVARINDELVEEMTRREAMEDALRESENRARAIFESAVDGVITFNDERLIETVNPSAEAIFGYSADELVGSHIHHLMMLGKADGPQQPSGNSDIPDPGLRLVTGWRKSGEVFPVELTISEVPLKGRTIYTGIIRDVTERTRLDRMKREFVSMVGHELRTPLTSIQGSLALLNTGILGDLPPRARSMVDIGLQNSERLLRLIGDILDIEKIESGKMEFTFEPIPVQALIRRAAEANGVMVDQFGVRLSIEPGEDTAVTVNGDSDRLMQVLANLLSNAAKYSPPGGTIRLGIERRGELVRIFVADQGPGVPQNFHDRIFQKFSQADSSDTRQKGGTGLGLNIVKAIVECHGGEIGFTSKEGAGATFYFDLPVLAAQQVKAASEPRTGPILLCGQGSLDRQIRDEIRLAVPGQAVFCDTVDLAALHIEGQRIQGVVCGPRSPQFDPGGIMNLLDATPTGRLTPVAMLFGSRQGTAAPYPRPLRLLDWLQAPVDIHRLRRRIETADLAAMSQNPGIVCLGFARDGAQQTIAGTASLSQICGDNGNASRSAPVHLVIVDAGHLTEEEAASLRTLMSAEEVPAFVIIAAPEMTPAAWDRLAGALGVPCLQSEQFAEEMQRVLNGRSLKRHIELFEHQESESRERTSAHHLC